jgi:hypothetical protein
MAVTAALPTATPSPSPTSPNTSRPEGGSAATIGGEFARDDRANGVADEETPARRGVIGGEQPCQSFVTDIRDDDLA